MQQVVTKMINEEEEKIEILINIRYGGWGISEKAIELYKLRNLNYITQEFDDHFFS